HYTNPVPAVCVSLPNCKHAIGPGMWSARPKLIIYGDNFIKIKNMGAATEAKTTFNLHHNPV
ncbi:hypothetical protein BLOT_007512, partial [Blomia tropicalis]